MAMRASAGLCMEFVPKRVFWRCLPQPGTSPPKRRFFCKKLSGRTHRGWQKWSRNVRFGGAGVPKTSIQHAYAWKSCQNAGVDNVLIDRAPARQSGTSSAKSLKEEHTLTSREGARMRVSVGWARRISNAREIIAENLAIYVVSDARPQIAFPKIAFLDNDCAKHIMLPTPMRQNYTFYIVFSLDFRRCWETAENHRERPYDLRRL